MSAPFKRGDWVAQVGVKQPSFGRVVDVFQDATCGYAEWLINYVVYDLKGNRVGRATLAWGGPTTFEPACPAKNYRKIQEPSFPIERVGLYGEYDHLLKDA